MTQDELIADTNRLLSRLLELDEQQRIEGNKIREEMDKNHDDWQKGFDERMREKMRERGVSEELLVGDNVDWEKRLKEAQERSKLRVEEAKEREQRYKNEVLGELRTQTELLQKIAGKLGL